MTNPTEEHLADRKQGRLLQARSGMLVGRLPLVRYRRPFWLTIAALTVMLGATYGLIIRPYHLRCPPTAQRRRWC
jgi:hypothetical protein